MSLNQIKHKLLPLRKKINNIDKNIFKLLKDRSYIIPKVKRIKKDTEFKIAFKREFDIANKINSQYKGIYHLGFIQKIWRELISATLYIENNLSINILDDQDIQSNWELGKDFFGSCSNLITEKNIDKIFVNLNQKKVDAAVLPLNDSQSQKWWLKLLEKENHNLKINLLLPYIKAFKTLNPNKKALIISLNNEDIINDNLFFIADKKDLPKLIEYKKVDQADDKVLIIGKAKDCKNLFFVGSSPNSIL